jgi:hypothetical protein
VEVDAMATESRLEWLAEAARAQVCPLCVASAGAESSFLAALCAQLQSGGEAVDAFVAGRGLCRRHTARFQQAAEDAAVGAEHVLSRYAWVLEDLIAQLSDLEQDEWLAGPECAVCVGRDRAAVASAHRLLAALQREPAATTELLLGTGGMCIAHFLLTWEVSPESADRDRLRRIEHAAASRLAAMLHDREPVPSDGAVARTATGRAIDFIAGWDPAVRQRAG